MADLRISELAALAGVNLAAGDLLPVVDVSASETKKITVTDLVGNATTLIADATIPGAKILFGAAQVPGSALVDAGVSTAKLADNAITAAKLANESTVDLVTTLPATGAFVGQLALDTDDLKIYCWDGSVWRSIKAAGSINAVVGSGSGIVNVTVSTTGDQVTISTTLDNTSGAGQFLAGPAGSGGSVGYRQIVGSDLPAPTVGSKGGVVVNGEGLRMDGDTLEIANDVTANSITYQVVQYSSKGLITNGRSITGADLPPATAGALGGVRPGTGLAVAVNGVLNHANIVSPTTASKVTFDAQGHVTGSSALLDTDIPNLPASKLTSGTLPTARIGDDAVTAVKLADYSTAQIANAQPTADYIGQLFFNPLDRTLFMWDGNVYQPIGVSYGQVIFAGTYDASTNLVKSVTSEGQAIGLAVGAALPAAVAANKAHYVVVDEAGTGTAPAPTIALSPPDILLSTGTEWVQLDVSDTVVAQLASNVQVVPAGNIASTNVQAALQELDSEKLPIAGGRMEGNLELGLNRTIIFEGSPDDGFETTLTVAGPTADRTITLPDVTGTVVTTGDSGTVTSTMIADGAIVNADINASAAIVDTKLATISTAGKVSNSATTATSANTASAIVARDGSGNFTAGTITASLTGAASLNLLKAGDTMTGALGIAAGTVSAPGLFFSGDTNTGLWSSGADALALSTNGNQRLAIDSSGRILVGPGTARAVGGAVVPTFAVETLGQAASFVRNSADTSGGIIALGKSRGTAAGDNTSVANGDILGEIRFAGANGTDMTSIGAHIRAEVAGEVGTAGDVTDMPTRLTFSTAPDGEATATQRLVIDSNGQIEAKSLGTAAAPVWSFVDDPNTGIYSPGSDQVAISTNGTGRITIDASGNVNIDSNTLYVDATNNRVGIGTTSPSAALDVLPAAATVGHRVRSSTTTAAVTALQVTPSDVSAAWFSILADGSFASFTHSTGPLLFAANNTERARIDSSGTLTVKGQGTAGVNAAVSFNGSAPVNSLIVDSSGRLLVGTSTSVGFGNGLQVKGGGIAVYRDDSSSGGAGPNLNLHRSRGGVVSSGDYLGSISFYGDDGTDLLTPGALIRAEVDGTPGADDMPGRLVFSTTADGASSPTERMRIQNNGKVLISKIASSLDTQGIQLNETGSLWLTTSSETCAEINRKTTDGNLIAFSQDTVLEGTISVSGTTVSYNGAHLSRWSQLPSGATREEILRGTVLSNIDEMCAWGEEDNEQLNRMKVSDVEGDPNVSGVFQAWDDDDDTYTDDFYCAMTGDFIIRISAGIPVHRGQLLMSAGDGTAKPQDDDIIRSKTIAKVTSNHITCTYDDGSYCVPCVLMAC
jgi:hypothetical protein